ncbi:MAG: penicillin-binding transpeptidase domain-containing protein [Oscillospiraceae bacterium]|nr:penicillin-binding transpeptidase domain-containing protein [Oscillospiraceae bacterium]
MNNPFERFQNKDAQTEQQSRRLQLRTGVLLGIFCCILLAYAGVLVRTQIVHGEEYLASSTSTILRSETVTTVRGSILDRSGTVLVTNELSHNITLDLSTIGDIDTLRTLLELCREEETEWTDTFPVSPSAPWEYTRENIFCYSSTDGEGSTTLSPTMLGTLCKQLGILSDPTGDFLTPEELMEALAQKLIPTRWEELSPGELRDMLGVLYELTLRKREITYNEYIFAKGVGISLISKIKERSLPGVTVVAAATRRYDTDAAPHVLGQIGKISADQWPDYRDKGYPMDAYVGKSGVELAFESYLHGSSGVRRTELDGEGNVLSESWSVEPHPGDNVVLTLDLPTQQKTEELLSDFVSSLDEPAGAAAVMVDMTGGVLATASFPDFDLATYYQDYNDLASDPARPLLNRATMGLYAPGSTFKPLTAIAALSTGVITPASTVQCTGRYFYYPDVQPACWVWNSYRGTHGWENVTQAITDSCNIFFYDVGRRTGIKTLVDYAGQFGLGDYTGIEVPEYKGHVAGPATSAAFGQQWYAGETMYASIGQSSNQFTPLQLANYIATLVNGGNHYEVHLLDSVMSSDYSQTVLDYEPVLRNTVEIKDTDLQAVKLGMYNLSKTASMNRHFASLPVEVGCKTGTAEVAGSTANAVFVCFAPYDDPQVALCIVAEKGASGGSLASIAAGMLAQYFGVEEPAEAETAE